MKVLKEIKRIIILLVLSDTILIIKGKCKSLLLKTERKRAFYVSLVKALTRAPIWNHVTLNWRLFTFFMCISFDEKS